jgi:uncharacterized protein YdeI (YjbR/CyaY-like superfamily)
MNMEEFNTLNKEETIAKLQLHGKKLRFVLPQFKQDREVVLVAVTQDGEALVYVSEELKQDKEIVLAAVTQYGWVLEYASKELKQDKEIVLAAVTQNGRVLESASEELKQDKEVVLAAVTQDGLALEYASEDLKGDKEVVLVAVNNDGSALQYVSEDLKQDKEVVLAAVNQYGSALQYASEDLKHDNEIVLAAVNQYGAALQYASEELKRDKKVMLSVVAQNGLALNYVSPDLKQDREIVLAAVTKYGRDLRYVSEKLKGDKEVVLAAVTQNGEALQFASEELKADKEFVLEAVTKNGESLKCASEELKQDKEVLEKLKNGRILALSQDGLSLASISAGDLTEEMCVIAVRQNNYAYRYVPKHFITPELVELLPVKRMQTALTRQISITKSNQTSAPTCSYHSMSRLFLQNRFIFVKPLQVDDIYDKNDCNRFLIPVEVEKTGLDTLDDVRCSPGGYDKILLFLYIYFLLKETDSCKQSIGELIPRQVAALKMPDFLKSTKYEHGAKHKHRLLSLLTEIKHLSSGLKWKEYSFSFNTIEEPLLFSVIQKLINLRFYVQLTCCGGREISHAVTIVGVQEGNYIIKNSWKELEDIVPSIKFFYLKGWPTPWMGTELLIYIPIISSEPTDGVKGKDYDISKLTMFDAWLDDYTVEIQRAPRGGRKTKRKKGTRRIKHKRTKRNLK